MKKANNLKVAAGTLAMLLLVACNGADTTDTLEDTTPPMDWNDDVINDGGTWDDQDWDIVPETITPDPVVPVEPMEVDPMDEPMEVDPMDEPMDDVQF